MNNIVIMHSKKYYSNKYGFLLWPVYHVRGKAISLQAWTGPWGYRMLRLPEFLDSRHMDVVRLSDLRTGCFYLSGKIIVTTHFCWRLSRPQGHNAAGRIRSIKISVTPSEINPATFRLVAQCLNILRHRVLCNTSNIAI